jgi:hypothetical protein
MDKKFIITLALLPCVALASSFPDCPPNKLSMNGQFDDQCISTCAAVAAVPSAQLSVNNSGFCVGEAEVSRFTLYEVRLGQSNSSEPSCNLWSGNFQFDKAQFSAGQEISAGGNFNVCKPGTYDVVYVKYDRNEIVAGKAVFPDGSSKVVRTTSAFSSNAIPSMDASLWLETSTSHSNNTLPYIRPTSGWNDAYKKLSSNPSATDLNSATSAEMIIDQAHFFALNSPGPLPGWYCDDNATIACDRLVDNKYIEGRFVMSAANADFLSPVGGIVVTDTKQPNWNLSYFGLNSGLERGLRFLWHNDAGTLKYLGVNAGESGLQINISLIDIAGDQ